MQIRVLSQLMLCAAAVLFLPQALDCCHHSESVLGALVQSVNAEDSHESMHHHSAESESDHAAMNHTELVPVAISPVRTTLCFTEMSPTPDEPQQAIDMADGHGANQSPGTGLNQSRNSLISTDQTHLLRIRAESIALTGLPNPPDAPPPRQ